MTQRAGSASKRPLGRCTLPGLCRAPSLGTCTQCLWRPRTQVWPGSSGGLWEGDKPQIDGKAGPSCLLEPLPTSTLLQSGGRDEGLGPVSLSENAWSLSSPQTTLVARHCPLAPEGLSGCRLETRAGSRGCGPGQVCQEVSLSGTLRPGVEDSECHFDGIKSWPRGGYVREASFSSELGCPGVSSSTVRACPHC